MARIDILAGRRFRFDEESRLLFGVDYLVSRSWIAGAVIARLSSIPVAFAASVAIGVLEQILLSGASGGGLVQLVLGATILVALLRQPRLSRRADDVIARYPWSARLGLPAGA